MAEALGIAASGVGIASLAIQLGNSILKLKSFCDAVKNAPEEIRHLIEEIETLSLVLSESESSEQPGLQVRPDSTSRCLQFCQKATSILRSVVKDVEAEIERRGRFGRVKAVLKRDAIEKLRGRLMTAQSMLLLSNQMYLVELQERNQQAYHDWAATHQQELNLIRFIVTQSTETFQSSLGHLQHAVQTSTTIVNDTFDQPSIALNNTNSSENCIQSLKLRSRQRMKRRIRLCTPEWLPGISRGIEIYESRACAGWSFSIQVYSIISDDSPIFTMIEEGNITDIQQLFSTGQASPFYRNEFGCTLLDRAACYQKLDICRLLIDEGASPNISWRSSAIVPAGWNPHLVERDCVLDLIRLLGQYSELQDPFDMQEEWRICSLDEDALALILQQSNSTYQERSVEERVAFALSICSTGQRDMRNVIRLILRGLEIDTTVCCSSDRCGETLLHKAANNLGYMTSPHLGLQDAKFDDLMGIICGFLKGGSDVHALTIYGRTPMLKILDGFFSIYNWDADTQKATRPLRIWLKQLRLSGVDLDEYGRREKAVLQSSNCPEVNTEFWYWVNRKCGRGSEHSNVRLTNFTYGPEPGDWIFWFAPVMQNWFLEFWDMLDHPERAMPGAWEDSWY